MYLPTSHYGGCPRIPQSHCATRGSGARGSGARGSSTRGRHCATGWYHGRHAIWWYDDHLDCRTARWYKNCCAVSSHKTCKSVTGARDDTIARGSVPRGSSASMRQQQRQRQRGRRRRRRRQRGGLPTSMSHAASLSSAVLEARLRGMTLGNPSSTLLSACSNPAPISTIPGDGVGSHAAAAPGALSFRGFHTPQCRSTPLSGGGKRQ